MSFDSAPKDASVEHLLEICEVLREGELTREELYEEVDQSKSLVRDNIRLGTGLRFLEESDEGVSATSRGIEASYNQGNSTDLAEQVRAGLQDYQLYNIVLKSLADNDFSGKESITKSDILQVFRTSVGLEGSESTLGDGATTFLQTLQYADLGNYVVGRRGKETRLELSEDFEDLVDDIVEEQEEDPQEEQDQEPSNERIEPRQEPTTGQVSYPEVESGSAFQINLELSGEEDPKQVEELIIGVRRGLARELDEKEKKVKTEPVEVDEEFENGQNSSEEEIVDSEKENTSEQNGQSDPESSDQSLDTFVGTESTAEEE